LIGNLIGLRYAVGFGALLLFIAAGIIMLSKVEAETVPDDPVRATL
jgi:hypothetical protein